MNLTIRDMLAIFVAALVQGSTGFGGGVIMNSVMSFFHPIEIISPLISAYKLLIGMLLLWGRILRGRLKVDTYRPQLNHQRMHIIVFIFCSFIGIFGGKFLLVYLTDQHARWLIAGIIIFGQCISRYAGNNESEPSPHATRNSLRKTHAKNYLLTGLTGLAAGIFGYAYNTNGPFVALFIIFQWVRKKHAINFSSLYFLGMNIIFLLMHSTFGFMYNFIQTDILIWFGLILIGGIIGICLQKHISEKRYFQIINIFLIISVILLLV